MQKYQDFTRILATAAPAPLATITVRNNGTGTLSTVFSDNGITPMANPFAADQTGYYRFYAADGRYDVTIDPVESGAPTYTLADILLDDTLV